MMNVRVKALLGSAGRELGLLAGPGGAGVLLLLLCLPPAPLEAALRDEKGHPLPPAVRMKRFDGGASRSINVSAIEKGYRDLKRSLETATQTAPRPTTRFLPSAHDAKIPACRRKRTRKASSQGVLPRGLRGRAFYVARLPKGGRLPLPPEIRKDPKAEILITKVERTSDLTLLSNRLNRRVSLVSAKVARLLGLTCVPARILTAKDGTSITLHETRENR